MIFSIFLTAVKKLRNNKCSIILAMIGIVVSTFVILMIFSFSNASKKLLISYLTYKYPILNSLTCKIEGGEKYFLTPDEIINIEDSEKKYINNIAYQTEFLNECTLENNDEVLLCGSYNKPISIKIVEGRFLTTQESMVDNCFNVVVSDKYAKEKNNKEKVLDRIVEIQLNNGCTYQMKIIGVYENLNEYADEPIVFGSFNTISRISGEIRPYKISKITVNVLDIRKVDKIKITMSSYFSNRYMNSSEYKYNIMVCDVLKSSNMLVNLFSVILIIFSSVIFIVSGISIRNVILTIMQTYVHQIGIKKAVGASENIICLEYFFQGIIITIVGTSVGYGLSVLMLRFLNNVIDSINEFIYRRYRMPYIYDADIKFYLTGIQSIFAFLFAIIIVSICCYAPVKKTAKMNVVDALRK